MAKKEEAAFFSEIAESLLAKKDLNTVLDTITRSACRFFNASAASIMLFDENREYLTIKRAYNLSPEYLKVVKVQRDEEIVGKVCQEKRPRIVQDIARLFKNMGDDFSLRWVEKEKLVSLVCAPLLVKNEAIGCLNIYFRAMLREFKQTGTLAFFTKLAALSIEHSRLIEETERSAQMSSSLGEIGLLVASSLDQEEVVKIFLSMATKITNTEASGLLLIDEDKKAILEAYEYSVKEGTPQKYKSSARLDEGISGEIIRTKRPVIISDTAKYPNVNPVSIRKSRAAIMGVPLLAKRGIVGIGYVDSPTPRDFTAEELGYLSILANYAAGALENTKLYCKVIQEAKETAILYEVSKTLISSLDIDQLLNNILQRLLEKFGYLNLAILLVDEEKQELKLRSYVNYPEEVKNLKIKIGETGITGHVAATKEIFYSPDVTKDPYYLKGAEETKSEVCFPLMVGEKLIGVLDVASPEYDGFTPDDINLLSSISAQLAIALDNSRLYEEAKLLSLTDPLTTLPNRRSFDLFIDAEIKRAVRYRRFFSVLMIDFDNFKDYNDKFGHSAGDTILQRFSKIMKETVREVDFLGRYGGDEFIAILPETDASFAWEVAERMRRKIEREKLEPNVTLSIGIATFPKDSKDRKKLIDLADQACYEAKELGGNRVNFAKK